MSSLPGAPAADAPARSVLREGRFGRFFLGASASAFGSAVSLFALPLIAAALGADAFTMGLLLAAETAPALLVSLPAGAYLDRHDLRRALLAMDVARAGLIGLIPLAALTGQLSLPLLIAVSFGVGGCTIVAEIGARTIVPSLVPENSLVAANAHLSLAESAASVSGPSLAGFLISLVGGPATLLFDGLSYVASALALRGLPVRPPELADDGPNPSLWSGLRLTVADPILRRLALMTGLSNVTTGMYLALATLFAVHELHLAAWQFGLLYSVANVGFLVGAAVSQALIGRAGFGRSFVLGTSLTALALVCVAAAAPGPAVLLFGLGRALGAVGNPIFNVGLYSLRQRRTRPANRARVLAAARLIDSGALPIGALLGGGLATWLGLRGVLALAAGLAVLVVVLAITGPFGRAALETARPPVD